MLNEELIKALEEVLTKELPVNDPDGLYQALAQTEVLSYLPAKNAVKADKARSEAEVKLKKARSATFSISEGTVTERNLKVDAETADLEAEVERYEREVRYWKDVSSMIKNRISLGQSILSIMSNEIKSGLR